MSCWKKKYIEKLHFLLYEGRSGLTDLSCVTCVWRDLLLHSQPCIREERDDERWRRRRRQGPHTLSRAFPGSLSVFLLLMKQFCRWFSHRSTLEHVFIALSSSALVIEQGEAIGWNSKVTSQPHFSQVSPSPFLPVLFTSTAKCNWYSCPESSY